MSVSVVRNDLTLYDRNGDGWWDPKDRAFASLRHVNALRLEILDAWMGSGNDLTDVFVVDLGCGGGLLSVPLAERGAGVVGIDRSEVSLATARDHAPAEADFLHADLCAVPLADAAADVVLLADVLEHVDDPAAA
ncbi:MAG: methyltransferase domain-containing protein, partial [Planctomycetes bacterium]|nr:methyltransferase domain-containing protein [Planctomycetota bacterium]